MDVRQQVTDQQWADAELVWEYHRLHHELRPCSAAIALGCNDIGVAAYTAELFHRGLFPVVVFSGANSPDTWSPFPRGEAVHYREHALRLGVPDRAILVEPDAMNTGDNVALSREVLRDHEVDVNSLMLVSMPYMERRAYATVRKQWREVEPVCASEPLTLAEYIQELGGDLEVIDMMVGDLQRVIEYPKRGFAIDQEVPAAVLGAFQRLVESGFDSRLLR